MNNDIINKNDVISLYQDLDVDLTLEILSNIYELSKYKEYSKSNLNKLRKEFEERVYLFSISYNSKINSKRLKGLKKIFSNITNDISKKYKDNDFDIDKNFNERDKIINNSIKSTNETLKSLGKKISLNVKKEMLNIFDTTAKELINGSKIFENLFKQVTDDLVKKGITFQDKLGRNWSVESVVRQELRYRSNECSRDYYKQIGKELNADGWDINITGNCRPTHKVINGKRFTNEEWKKYEYLTHDYNCNHVAEPIFKWESKKYTQKEIDDANNKQVSFNGEKISYYDATQMQRAYERAIRNAKKQCVVAKSLNIDVNKAKRNLINVQSKMTNFINQTGLTRNYSREFFSGYSK